MDDGGSAFPLGYRVEGCDHEFGMTLRDYFASKALCGFLSAPEANADKRWIDEGLKASEIAARASYQIADAMLAERKKNNPSK